MKTKNYTLLSSNKIMFQIINRNCSKISHQEVKFLMNKLEAFEWIKEAMPLIMFQVRTSIQQLE